MLTKTKHAYLILAHANPYVLEKLILSLDDERNDIYIHVDKKTRDFDFDFFKSLPQKSKLIFIERIKTYWGHISLVRAELMLFRKAFERREYTYYHLISGSDLPLKNPDEIHSFFRGNDGKEFIGFSDDKFDEERVDKIHLFHKYMRIEKKTPFRPVKKVLRKIRVLFLDGQRKFNFKAKRSTSSKFLYGSQWVSVSHRFVSELLKNEDSILKLYRYSNCPDEIYKQTFAYNSGFRNSIYNLENELVSCQRFMDWKRGRPYTFREEDFGLLISSSFLFARKFEDSVDKKIVDRIYQDVIQ